MHACDIKFAVINVRGTCLIHENHEHLYPRNILAIRYSLLETFNTILFYEQILTHKNNLFKTTLQGNRRLNLMLNLAVTKLLMNRSPILLYNCNDKFGMHYGIIIKFKHDLWEKFFVFFVVEHRILVKRALRGMVPCFNYDHM